MLDVDNELVKLRSQASVLAADIQALEAVLGMDNIIQARTTRQIQQINSGSHRGQSSSSSSTTKPERSFFGAIEAWGAKINMCSARAATNHSWSLVRRQEGDRRASR